MDRAAVVGQPWHRITALGRRRRRSETSHCTLRMSSGQTNGRSLRYRRSAACGGARGTRTLDLLPPVHNSRHSPKSVFTNAHCDVRTSTNAGRSTFRSEPTPGSHPSSTWSTTVIRQPQTRGTPVESRLTRETRVESAAELIGTAGSGVVPGRHRGRDRRPDRPRRGQGGERLDPRTGEDPSNRQGRPGFASLAWVPWNPSTWLRTAWPRGRTSTTRWSWATSTPPGRCGRRHRGLGRALGHRRVPSLPREWRRRRSRRGCRNRGAAAVAPDRPRLADLPGSPPAHRVGVGVGGEQGVDERGEHLAQQVRRRLGEVLMQELGEVDTGRCGHRVRSSSKVLWKVHSKDHAVPAPVYDDTGSPSYRYTTLLDSTRKCPLVRWPGLSTSPSFPHQTGTSAYLLTRVNPAAWNAEEARVEGVAQVGHGERGSSACIGLGRSPVSPQPRQCAAESSPAL